MLNEPPIAAGDSLHSGLLAAVSFEGRFLESIGHQSHAWKNPACRLTWLKPEAEAG